MMQTDGWALGLPPARNYPSLRFKEKHTPWTSAFSVFYLAFPTPHLRAASPHHSTEFRATLHDKQTNKQPWMCIPTIINHSITKQSHSKKKRSDEKWPAMHGQIFRRHQIPVNFLIT